MAAKLFALIFLLTLQTFEFSDVPDRTFIENHITNSTQQLIQQEAKLKKKLEYSYSLVKVCSTNLNASKISINFIDVLVKYYAQIKKIQSMNDHQTLKISLTKSLPYDYAQFRFSTIFSEIKQSRVIKANLQKNSTILYQFSQNVTKQYLDNYGVISKITSKNKFVNTVLRNILAIGTAFGSYTHQLNVHISNSLKLTSYLTNLIASKTILPPANVSMNPFVASLRAIETKLIVAQQHSITMAKISLRKIAAVEKSVETNRKVQIGFGNPFTAVKYWLEDCTKFNEYSLLGFPVMPDMSENDDERQMKDIMAENGRKNLDNSKNRASNNRENIRTEYNSLKLFTGQSSARIVQAQSSTFVEALDAILKVINSLSTYVEKLTNATTEVVKLQDTLYPNKKCGTFEYYILNNNSWPEKIGFQGGVHFLDGSTKLYVAYGASSFACGYIPGYLIITNATFTLICSGSGIQTVNHSTNYLLAHRKLSWVPTNNATLGNVTGKILPSLSFKNYFGRTLVNNFYMLGKITDGKLYYQVDAKNYTTKSDDFEVLICSP